MSVELILIHTFYGGVAENWEIVFATEYLEGEILASQANITMKYQL